MTAKGWDREEGVTAERKRDARGEGGTGVTPASFSQKRGLRWGRLRQPSLLLAGTMWSSLLPLSPSEGLCFTRKQQRWPLLAWPSAPSKLAAARKGERLGWGWRESKVIVRKGGVMDMSRMPVLSGHWCHACAHRGRAAEGPRHPILCSPSLHSLFSRMNESLKSGSPLSPIIDADYPNFMQPSQCEEVPWVLALRTTAMQ